MIKFLDHYKVSIHAPRVGCDTIACHSLTVSSLFQFTHPVWGATVAWHARLVVHGVSIHAPRVGCDFSVKAVIATVAQFQFTHPVWGATSRRGQ